MANHNWVCGKDPSLVIAPFIGELGGKPLHVVHGAVYGALNHVVGGAPLDDTSGNYAGGISDITASAQHIAKAYNVLESLHGGIWWGQICDGDTKYRDPHKDEWNDANLDKFLLQYWNDLGPLNVIVTHSKFLMKVFRIRGVPNGGIVAAKCGNKTLLFVRHCPSCTNVGSRWQNNMRVTQCAYYDWRLQAAAWIIYQVKKQEKHDGICYFCSPLPRAIQTAIYLSYLIRSLSPQDPPGDIWGAVNWEVVDGALKELYAGTNCGAYQAETFEEMRKKSDREEKDTKKKKPKWYPLVENKYYILPEPTKACSSSQRRWIRIFSQSS